MGQVSLQRGAEASAPAALAAPDAGRVRKALAAARAANTRRAYSGHWATFSAWCGENGYFPAPAKAETVAAHLASVAETVCTYAGAWRRPPGPPGLGDGFSGHSGRVGVAAELSRAGATTHEIAVADGWKSAGMVIRYTRRETARRGDVARYLENREESPD